VYTDRPTATDDADLKKILRAVGNNVPGLLQELQLSDAKLIQPQRTQRIPVPPRSALMDRF
jgi:hypothetical protein